MNRFFQYLLVFALFGLAIVVMGIEGRPTAWDGLSLIVAIVIGVLGNKWKIGKL